MIKRPNISIALMAAMLTVAGQAKANDATFGGAGGALAPLKETREDGIRAYHYRTENDGNGRLRPSTRLKIQQTNAYTQMASQSSHARVIATKSIRTRCMDCERACVTRRRQPAR